MSAAQEQPKKPQTAFFLYIDQHRPAVTKELGERAKEKGLIVKTLAERWRGLTPAKKAPFETQAAAAKKDYEAAMESFKAAGGVVAARKTSRADAKPQKDPDAPKRPSGGGYGVFLAENRAAIVKSLPKGHKITDVTKAAGAQWKALTPAKQQPYTKKFEAKTAAYKAALEAYNAEKGGAAEEDAEEDDAEEGEEEEEEAEEEAEAVPTPSPAAKKRAPAGEGEGAPSAKRGRGAKAAKGAEEDEDAAVMGEAKELNYQRQLKSLQENPKVAAKGTSLRQALNALKEAKGSTVAARKVLVGGG